MSARSGPILSVYLVGKVVATPFTNYLYVTYFNIVYL